MIFTKEDNINFDNATKCWICSGESNADDLANENKRKVRDHCHFTGKYRGAAHSSCNLKFTKPKFTPVIFHNLANYDAHLFVKNLGKTEGNIKCTPNTDEKYISFSKNIKVDSYLNKKEEEVKVMHKIRFIDSFKFMPSSLDNLVSNFSIDQLIRTQKVFGKQIDLISRKGIYPYEYMDKIEKFDETKLPNRGEFFLRLNGNHISDKDYEHAEKIWKEFSIKTMGEFHDLYLISDVLLLAHVFEAFRKVCLENYSLDPA